MRRLPRPTARVRLTALYAAVVALTLAAILFASYQLMDGHLHRTLTDAAADDALDRLADQYLIALGGALLLAVGLGWLLAGRVLRPLSRITATAREVSEDRLGERIALDGPDDELRELAGTFDAMLERLEGAFEAQKRFVANASHELRSPLTVIRTEADVALDDPDASREELREALHGVLQAADRTDALLEALLVLARSQRGLVATDAVDLAGVVRRAVEGVREEAAAKGVDVRGSLAGAVTCGDRTLLERVVANLLENAVRHNRPGGTVEVVTDQADGWAALRIANTGVHLTPQDTARMTEPFERLGRRAGPGGSGLGLSIVASVVDAHGGRLELRPRADGGLEAEVLLPPLRSGSSSGAAPGAGRAPDSLATTTSPGAPT